MWERLPIRWQIGRMASTLADQHTLAEVGEQIQISRERVGQIENEALQKLRRPDGERSFAYHQEL